MELLIASQARVVSSKNWLTAQANLFGYLVMLLRSAVNLWEGYRWCCRDEDCKPCLPRNPSASRIDPAEDEPIQSNYSDADFMIPSLKWKMKHPGGDKEYEAVPHNETGDDDASEEEDFDDVQESRNDAQYVPGVYPSMEEDP